MELEGRIYHPLNSSQDIRVMELCPGTFNDVLTCNLDVCLVEFEYPPNQFDKTMKKYTLHAVSRASGQRIWYTALSYVWGNPAFIKPI